MAARTEERVRATLSDDELLVSRDPAAFGVFYARHVRGVERFFARHVGFDAAEDLAAETFASALVARRRFVPGATPAVGWLYTIARRRLVDFQRRGQVRQRTLKALASEATRWEPQAASWSEEATELDLGLLRHLPRDQRDAIVAHVIHDRDYGQLASDLRVSEASIRQRVSRGLTALRNPLRVYRAAQELARQDRDYRFGAGHFRLLSSIGPREPLDCSSSASLILMRAGLLEPGYAWTSGRLAEEWGSPGEGRYVTVWANQEHVWLEFKLDAGHDERFDPTPLRLAPNSAWLSSMAGPTREFVPRHARGL
jgi:RNA polymerase sigma-70 factor (ECF subfamily)